MKIVDLAKQYQDLDGKQVTIQGWLRNHRVGKNISFMMVNDGTCFDVIQVVYKDIENQEEISKTNIASAVEITGTVKVTEGSKQDFEIVADAIEVLAASSEDYPLQPKKHSYEFLREISHLRARSNTFNAVFRIRSLCSQILHEYFAKEGYVHVHSPILTGADAEGAGEMFQVTTLDLDNVPKTEEGQVDYKKDFFGKQANLTVSGQLLAETYALAFQKVYTFGPTFRAEHSNTTRHVAEFWMLEPEIAFAGLDEVIELEKDMLIYTVGELLKRAPKELAFLNSLKDYDLVERLESLVSANFGRITYTEAVEMLQADIEAGKVKFENEVFWGVDLATEHEKYLTDVVFKTPLFVTDYPRDIKAFYMRVNDDMKTVAATDLLVPGIGELCGGSAREERLDLLDEQMSKFNIDTEELNWYRDLRRYGGVKHAGFGIGFERLVMYVTGMENIRDVSSYPRTVRNLEF
ncbi:asparagine--tRNA ligase [Mollicutes bacterium LVI A0039]|nr:asparagine--tRNA ligase [Mollicutes bacterium LVI A0039]